MANRKAKCTSFVQGRVMRVTKVDACGNPIVGDASVVTSDGFVSVAYTANTDEGEEINQKNAAGRTCVRVPAKPTFLGYTIEIQFCGVDPDLFAMLTGQRALTDANGVVDGFAMNSSVIAADHYFALEVWAGAESDGGCDEGAEGKYGYILLPLVQGGIVGDFTVENAVVTFSVQNASSKDGNGWGVGPYNVVADIAGDPAPLPEALETDDHLIMKETPIAPPEAECGARPFLDPEGEAATGTTTTPTLLSVLFAVTPTAADPFWIDFGDGYWDYSDDGSNLTHVYEAAGTYTYVVHRGTSTYTSTVTVAA